jgi:hypothetical protein
VLTKETIGLPGSDNSSPARGAPHHSARDHAARLSQSPAHSPAKPPRQLPGIPLKLLAGGFVVLLIIIGAAWAFTRLPSVLPGGDPNATPATTKSQSSGIPPVGGKCAEGLTLCSGSCVNLKTDAANCGGCGFEVPFGESCINGKFSGTLITKTVTSPGSNATTTPAAAQITCPPPQNPCSGVCRDVLNDPANCGYCGNTCPSGQTCRAGMCALPGSATTAATASIPATLVVDLTCSGRETVCGNACVNLMTDKKNCAVCGRACKADEICLDGRCGPACANNGTTLCNDLCVDLDTDMENCGACGAECETFLPNARGSLCDSGTCILSGCKTDYADCDKTLSNGCEVNLLRDANNCGSCGRKCASGEVCYNKKCSKPAI